MSSIIKCYSELITIPTFEERFEYLKLGGSVGVETFGHDRYLNQMFYASLEWKRLRHEIIVRDLACDLAMPGYDIHSMIMIHHINPITKYDVINKTSKLFDPENLITTTKSTHDAIHYGSLNFKVQAPITRTPNDTCPWKR